MNEEIRALIMATGAGFSTTLGALIIFWPAKNKERLITIALGFAAGVMLCVSFTDLYPTAVEYISRSAGNRGGIAFSVLFLIVGICIASLIDRFVPHQEYDEQEGAKPHQNLFRVGVVSMMAIALHNFPEGIATFMAAYSDATLGISIAIAITLHNIPEGMSVAVPIYYATKSRAKAFKYAFLSGVAEPIGALLAFSLLRPFINDFVMGCVFSAIAGIMLYICIEELIPSSRQYGYDNHALVATLAGICIMPLTHIL